MRSKIALSAAVFLLVLSGQSAAKKLKAKNPSPPPAAPAAQPLPPQDEPLPQRSGGIVKFGQDVDVRAEDSVEGPVFVVNGSVTVAGNVEGPVVVVGGSATLRSGAHIAGPVIAFGGRTKVEQGSETEGPLLEFPRSFVPWRLVGLAVGPAVGLLGSVWLVYKIFNTLGWIALALILWILFPEALGNSLESLKTRPRLAVLTGVLFWPSIGVVSLIFLISIVGIPILPFLALASACAWFWGFTTLGLFIGDHLSAQGLWERPIVSILVGTAILRVIEWIPLLGLVTYLAVACAGIGVTLISRFGTRRA